MIDKVYYNGKYISKKEYIKNLKTTPIINLNKVKKNEIIVKTLDSIIQKCRELKMIDEEDPNIKSLSLKLSALNRVINDYYILLKNKTKKSDIVEIFQKYNYQGKRVFSDEEIEKIMGHSKKFVDVVDKIENLQKKLFKARENYDNDSKVLKNISTPAPSLFLHVKPLPIKHFGKEAHGGSKAVDNLKKLDKGIKKIDSGIKAGIETADKLQQKALEAQEKAGEFLNKIQNWDDFINKKAAEFDDAIISDVDIELWEWVFFGLHSLERKHPILSYPLDLIGSVLQGTDSLMDLIGKITGFLGGFGGDGIWSILSAVMSVVGLIPFAGSVSSGIDIVVNVLDPFIGTLAGFVSDIGGDVIDGVSGLLSFIFNLSRKNWGLAIYSFFDVLDMFSIDASDTYDGILTNINIINRYLFTINQLINDFLQIPNAGEIIIDGYGKVKHIFDKLPIATIHNLLIEYIANLGSIANGTIVLTNSIVKQLTFPQHFASSVLQDVLSKNIVVEETKDIETDAGNETATDTNKTNN